MIRNLITLLFFIGTKQVLACDCKTVSKNSDYENSFLVFVGEIIQVDSGRFAVRAQEFFKGDEFEIAISVIDDCSITPKVGEVWLIYASEFGEDEIHVSLCSSSRSFNRPFNFNSQNFPRPTKNTDTNHAEIINRINLDLALDELYFDISFLRSKKEREERKLMMQSVNELKAQGTQISQQMTLWNWSIAILSVVVFGSLILNLRKK